nr:fatty acyl-CoA reductase wat-like [Leptinotarsa decemlineata]
MGTSGIKDFYLYSKVFITGGTGFMGKILVEKLLRSTEVSMLYLLIREKRGKTAHQVLDLLLQDKIFNKMKEICPNYRQKIQLVQGDCSVSGLGLGTSDRQMLISNTDIIFHLAATVRFNADLKTAYRINVCGTKGLILLAKQMGNLKSFVHVSTAYSNFPVNYIQEKLYDMPESLEEMCQTIEKLDEDYINKYTERIIEPWPNTYTFTKAIAEMVIKNGADQLPIGVFRPSVVMPTYREPIASWTDNLNGPSGICLGIIKGILKLGPCDHNESLADLVPVDMCVNGLLASAWDISAKRNSSIPETTPVYNYVCGADKSPIRWRELLKISAVYGRKYVDNSANIFVIFTNFAICHWVLDMVYHIIPAFFMDMFLFLRGKRMRLLTTHRKIRKMFILLSPVYTNTWNFDNDNITRLWNRTNERDREDFPFSLQDVNWNNYFASYIRGLKEQFHVKPINLSHWFAIFWQLLKILLVFFTCNTVISKYQSVAEINY